MSKTQRKRQGKPTAQDLRKVRRYLKQFYYYRYHLDDSSDEMITHRGYRGLIIPGGMDEVEFQVQHTAFRWQVATVSFCRDPWGKEYRLFGFAVTDSPMLVAKQSIRPVIMSAIEYAEGAANTKHIYAHGVVMAPWSVEFPDLVAILRLRHKELHLTQEDLVEIADYPTLAPEVYEFDPNEAWDLDHQIANLL